MNKYIKVLTLQEHKKVHSEGLLKSKNIVKSLLTKKRREHGFSR